MFVIQAYSYRLLIKNIISSKLQSSECMIKRRLSLHEYHSFRLLEEAGVPVPPFVVASNKVDAGEKVRKLKTDNLVIKAQVLTGARSKGFFKGGLKGGIKMVNSADEAEKIAGQMIGDYLVTQQTGAKGLLCNYVMIAKRLKIIKEFYLGIIMERNFGGPVILSSVHGGADIDHLSKTTPEAINYTPVDIIKGLERREAEEIAEKIDLGDKKKEAGEIVMKLYEIFIKRDALLIDINPLGLDHQGNLWCIDAKLKFDDDAAYKQRTLHSLRDTSQEDPRVIQAAKHKFSYVPMDGNIGCLVSGAGLAMATIDIINLHGGSPANFVNVSSLRGSKERLKAGLKLIMSEPSVMVVFINIFDGRCEVIAEGIVLAIQELNIDVPIVCRLQGRNAKDARILLGMANLKILPVPDLEEASRLVVKVAQIMVLAKSKNVKVNFELPI